MSSAIALETFVPRVFSNRCDVSETASLEDFVSASPVASCTEGTVELSSRAKRSKQSGEIGGERRAILMICLY